MENLRDVEGRRFDLRRERRTEKIWGSRSENQSRRPAHCLA
ncbi:hypothetical protein CIPAW_03G057400 [Carya illinoinensis]|uniref:Uncharacterized protein n=1 Tax=Carya illinoinensis TaxID=32201 RepID=A0A8T1QZ67_CARIL|nr:hypothetical protein CIPAW_03G057400 [Carya illinoinensis]